MTSKWRRCDAVTSHRCQYDVVTTSCACWEFGPHLTPPPQYSKPLPPHPPPPPPKYSKPSYAYGTCRQNVADTKTDDSLTYKIPGLRRLCHIFILFSLISTYLFRFFTTCIYSFFLYFLSHNHFFTTCSRLLFGVVLKCRILIHNYMGSTWYRSQQSVRHIMTGSDCDRGGGVGAGCGGGSVPTFTDIY